MNGVPAPLAEDEDSDFGHESWYDRKDDKKGKMKSLRSGRRGKPRKSDVKNPMDGDDDRTANFNLLDHSFPSDGSDEENFFDSDYSKPRSRLHMPAALSAPLDAETPAFVLERRGRHKPLDSYFEDAVSDRESSVDRGKESRFQVARHTQKGPKRGRKVDTTASSSDVETPTNPMVKPTPPDDGGSVTGKPNFSHQFTHDTLTLRPQNQKRKLMSRHS